MNTRAIALFVLITLALVPQTWALTAYDYVSLIPERSTPQCLVDCQTTYELSNPTASPLTYDEATWWFEFRDRQDMTIRKADRVQPLKEFHQWRERTVVVQRNMSILDAVQSECTVLSTQPNLTYAACPAKKYHLVQLNSTLLTHDNVDRFNITLMPGRKMNITITGKKQPRESVDNIPVIFDGTRELKATNFAWWDGNWSSRVNLNIQPDGIIDIKHILEPFELNLSNMSYILNVCANHSLVNCSDIRTLANDTENNWIELAHNITFYNNTKTSWLTLLLPNTTQTGITAYNYTLWLYFNNTIAGDNGITIYKNYDEFDQGIVSREFTTLSSTFGVNTTFFKGVLGRTSLAVLSGVQASVKSTNTWANGDRILASISSGNVIRAAGFTGYGINLGDVSGRYFKTTCPVLNIIGVGDQNTGACTTSGVYNSTNEKWVQIKIDVTGVATTRFETNGVALENSNTVGQLYWGSFSGATQTSYADRFRVSTLNLSFYENDSLWTNSSIETFVAVVPGNPFECVNQTFNINTSSIEHQEQPSTFNLTWNATNVTTRSASFFYNNVNYSGSQITEAITANNSATNNSLFSVRINTTIVATNATTTNAIWVVNCVLNNGTTRGVSTRNQSQTIGLAHREDNFNYTTPVGEGSHNNYTINLSLFNTVSYANLTFYINGVEQNNATQNFSGLIAPTLNGSLYNVTNQSTGLVALNNTAQAILFQQSVVYTNGSVKLVNTTTQNQSLIWSYIPKTLNLTTQIIERMVINITNNLSIVNNGDIQHVTSIVEFNNTNYSSTSYTNISNEYSFVHQIDTGIVLNNGRDYNTTVKGFFNITTTGSSVVRNSTTNRQARQVWLVYLGNCSAGFSNNQSLNFSILDQSTFAILGNVQNANLQNNIVVWATNQSYNRTYNTSAQVNTSYALCISPDFGSFNATRLSLASATGYNSKTTFFGPFGVTSAVQFVTLYLVNSSSTAFTQVVVNVVDENDNALENQLVTIERFDNITNFTLVDSKLTDFQGNAPFSLDTSLQYRINISQGGVLRTLTSLQPASVGPFQILSTPLTFRVLVGSSAGLDKLLSILNVQHNLTWSNSTKSFRLDFDDIQQVTDFVCLKVSYQNISGLYSLGSNCSTNFSDTLYFGVGALNGSFTAQATGHNPDPGEFLMDTLNVIYPGASLFGKEGYIWAILLTGTFAVIGAFVTGANPVGMVAGTLLGVILSNMLSLVAVGWGVYLGMVVVGGILIYYFKT